MRRAARTYTVGTHLVAVIFALHALAGTGAAAPACPSAVLFASDPARSLADIGWTGVGHGLHLGPWALGFALGECSTTPTGSCGTCRVTGTLGRPRLRRCQNASWVSCQRDADCAAAGAPGPCTRFLTAPMPSAVEGVGVCVVQRVEANAGGAINVARGELRIALPLALTVAAGPAASPCPRCVGDPTANDGVAGGTCDSGTRVHQACDAHAQSPVPSFGATSLDCPVGDVGGAARVAVPSVVVQLSSDAQRLALESTSPTARAMGFTSQKSLCDVCADEPTRACQSAADCASGVCGGPAGRPPALNACEDGVCTLAADGVAGECRGGPFEGSCQPSEPFRPCQEDAQCRIPGDTCQGRPRKCFPVSGHVGESVTVPAAADVPVSQVAHPTLGALFCSPPTRSTMVNETYGLPGPVRLQVAGTLSLSVRAGELQ